MKSIQAILLLTSCLALGACGKTTSTPGNPQQTISTDRSTDEAKVDLYEMNSGITLDARIDGSDELQPVNVEAGAVVSVIEQSTDGQWVRLGIENGDDNVLDVWVSRATADQMDMSVIQDSDPYDADGNEIPSLNEQFSLRKKMTYCYKYVKLYLLNHGMVKSYLPGGSAYMAYGILPKYGFKLVNRKPSGAIVNDVCVYGGGNGGNGHIEIKTSKGWYYGYGYISHPIANHPLKGCFHKPGF